MRWAKTYFAIQAAAGAAWWASVFTLGFVRTATLGSLDPRIVAIADIPLFVVASLVAAFGVRPAVVVASVWPALVVAGLALYATITTEAGWGVVLMTASAGGSVIAGSSIWFGKVPTQFLVRGPFAFRPARRRSNSTVDALASIAQMLVFWGLFLVVFPVAIALLERRWMLTLDFPESVRIFGICVLVLASALGVTTALTMSIRGHGTPLPAAMPNELVVAGPYRWVRNPMALSGIVQGVAVGLVLSSWLVVIYAIVGSVLWNYAVRPLEEADLESRFGDAFREYQHNVRCWIPRIPR